MLPSYTLCRFPGAPHCDSGPAARCHCACGLAMTWTTAHTRDPGWRRARQGRTCAESFPIILQGPHNAFRHHLSTSLSPRGHNPLPAVLSYLNPDVCNHLLYSLPIESGTSLMMSAELHIMIPRQRATKGASERAPHVHQPLHLHAAHAANRLRSHGSTPSRRSSRRRSVRACRKTDRRSMLNASGARREAKEKTDCRVNGQAVHVSRRRRCTMPGVCLAGSRPTQLVCQ